MDIINKVRPDEIYNLAAQSHVRVSFDVPEYTADITALGALRILESIRILKLKKTKYYQASSSEMYGLVKNKKSLNENTPFHPRSIYGVSKVFAYHLQFTIERRTEFLLPMVFYSTMSLPEEVRLLLQKKLYKD